MSFTKRFLLSKKANLNFLEKMRKLIIAYLCLIVWPSSGISAQENQQEVDTLFISMATAFSYHFDKDEFNKMKLSAVLDLIDERTYLTYKHYYKEIESFVIVKKVGEKYSFNRELKAFIAPKEIPHLSRDEVIEELAEGIASGWTRIVIRANKKGERWFYLDPLRYEIM